MDDDDDASRAGCGMVYIIYSNIPYTYSRVYILYHHKSAISKSQSCHQAAVGGGHEAEPKRQNKAARS